MVRPYLRPSKLKCRSQNAGKVDTGWKIEMPASALLATSIWILHMQGDIDILCRLVILLLWVLMHSRNVGKRIGVKGEGHKKANALKCFPLS